MGAFSLIVVINLLNSCVMGGGDVVKTNVDVTTTEEKGPAKSPPSASAPRQARWERKLQQHKVFLPNDFKTFVVDSTKAFDSIVKTFRRDIQDFRIISVDTVTGVTTNGKSGVNGSGCIDILQIGTFNGRAFLFRLPMMNSSETNYLRNIMSDPTIVKMGSLFHSDTKRLANDWGIYVHNWIDVQNVALNCLDRKMIGKSQGTRIMTKNYVGEELSPFHLPTMGNWSVKELSDSQIQFAATSVMAVIDIFCSIYANRMRLTTVSTEDIKQHIAWSRFYANAFYSAFS